MKTVAIALILLLLSMTINKGEILEQTLPDAGRKIAGARLPFYRHVFDLKNTRHLKFSVKASQDGFLLFSEKIANSMNYNIDHEYVEVNIGAHGNKKTLIRVGTMDGNGEDVNTLKILSSNKFSYFWATWDNGIIKLGHGFEINQDVIIQRSYPATTDIKYLALFNGFGSEGFWRLFIGIYY